MTTQSKPTPPATATVATGSSPTTGATKKEAVGTTLASKLALPTPPTTVPAAPATPAGYTPLTTEAKRKFRKLPQTLLPSVAPVATELKASTTYAEDFGSFAPDQGTLVSMLVAVGVLEAASGSSELWSSYVNDERLTIDDAALTLMGQLGKIYKLSLEQDSALTQKYPALTAFLAARTQPAERAKATKKEKAKAKASTPAAPAAPAPASTGTGH